MVCIAVYAASACIDHWLHSRIPDAAARWTAACAIVESGAVLALSVYLLSLRLFGKVKKGIYDPIRPAIRDRVMSLAFEGESWTAGIPKHGPARHVMEEAIEEALTSLKASGRDRVARFAVEEGLQLEWQKAFSSPSKRERKRAVFLLGLVARAAGKTILPLAAKDREPAIRAEAWRALAASDAASIDAVFRSVLRESLFVRALLADELKRHAAYLASNTVPNVLEQSSTFEIARCLELLIGWERALPRFSVQRWLNGTPDPVLWPLALALLPYVAPDTATDEHLMEALESGNPDVQYAAARAAGRLRQKALIPKLAAMLDKDKRVALASAAAIAQMGEPGERCLEEMIMGPDRRAAAIAMEALEHATVRAH
ncbi:MAG: hypothetical protein JO211_17285 [Acidobacteriaceae bacterium]|nr:hypothetical protein [Acidobacteriaceae bacterium]